MKREFTTERKLKFGVELECITSHSQSELVDLITGAGVKCQSIVGNVHRVIPKAWKVVYDGSVSNGWEIVSPPSSNFDDLEKVCNVLNANGVSVNKKCGFHVHHQIKDLDIKAIKNIYEIYNKYEKDVIDMYVPKSRRIGSECRRWCRPLFEIMDEIRSADTINDLVVDNNVGGGRGGSHYKDCRYRSINFRAYVQYGTIEFRQHSGTLDFEKIKNWVLFTHKIIEVATQKKKIRPVTAKRYAKWQEDVKHSSYDLYLELGINSTEVAKYFGNRRKQLSIAE